MGNQQNLSSDTVESRGLVEIIYSTTTGTSKMAADRLQELLQDNKYLAPVINIGDYQIEDLINHQGTIIFLLSTYGDGSAPADGEKFLEWLEKLKPEQKFSKVDFAVCAFGNSNFQKHCGFGLIVQKILKEGGANQLMELNKCDASARDSNMDARFPNFSKTLIETLNAKNSLRQISKSALSSPYQVTCQDRPEFNWQQNASKMRNLGQEFTNYSNMHKCRVIHLQQLRNGNKDGRSTLWVRLEINKDIRLSPACNVQIFPINSLDNDPRDSHIVVFNEVKGKVPFPPMPLREIRKLLDYRQKASNKQIKNALLLSNSDVSICQQYNNRMKQKKELDLTIQQLVKQIKPKLSFLPFVNLNRVRTYTLSSWDQEHRYLDLTVALTPKGLTSSYLQTFPEYIRMKPIDSTFYIPEGRPLVMIANGSGIAPFRSVVQYVVSNKIRLPYMRLYFGIQNEQVDYYYKQQWKQYEKNKILQVKLAQSRRNPNVKQYVQNILDQDKDWLQQHIFKNNGVIFICGGGGMCKDVGNIIFNVVAAEIKIPYKAFSHIAQLKQKATIVEQAFDS